MSKVFLIVFQLVIGLVIYVHERIKRPRKIETDAERAKRFDDEAW